MFCSNSSRWMVYFRVCFCLGKTYDREMVLKSGLLEKTLWESGYKCLADRGFTVCDLFDDLSQAKVAVIFTGTRPTLCRRNNNKSANCSGKVHVEQQIQSLKCFQTFSQPLPLKMAGSLNQMMTVCAIVCNLQNPIIAKISTVYFKILVTQIIKFHNFTNICSRSIIQTVRKTLSKGRLEY